MASVPALAWLESTVGCGNTGNSRPMPPEAAASIHRSVGRKPADVTRRLLDSLGGIASLVGPDDIVIIKPNGQWWHQGMTNTDVMAEFIEQILAMPDFEGEIVIVDNHQSKERNSRAWTTDKRNGRFNYNELVMYFNDRGFANVTKYHWHPAGANPTPLQMDGEGDSVIEHPSEGDGYIWPKDLHYTCPHGHKTVLAYPVFTSTYSGTTVDLKDGAFRNGTYTGQPVKFFNFSALNHHSRYAGVTASIKNYMGVVDMSCGYPAPEPAGTFNTHHVGASRMFRFLAKRRRQLEDLPWFWDIYLSQSVFRFRYTGGVLGAFMREIRRADLNIVTAITAGWGSRIDPDKAFRANTVLASTDPVALDYWAAANVLLPATKELSGDDEVLINLNDPTDESGPLRRFLEECRRELGGTTNPGLINVVEA